MHLKVFAAVAAAGLLLFVPAAAEAACCDQKHQGHQAKACCADHHATAEPTIVEQFMETDPQLTPAPPTRQVVEAWFAQPTLIGRTIVQGRYVIEHDNDRMARGEPCTHVYAANDQQTPVATFNCTHLERERAGHNLLVLINDSATGMKRLVEFQFLGETAAHGHPTVR